MFLQEKIIDNEFRILKVTSNKYKQNLKYLIQFVKFSTFYPLTRLNFIKQLLLVNKIKIKRIPASKLNIIISEKIQLVNPKCSLAVTKVFGGNQWIHRAAGHDLPLDESAWLSQLLKKVVLID